MTADFPRESPQPIRGGNSARRCASPPQGARGSGATSGAVPPNGRAARRRGGGRALPPGESAARRGRCSCRRRSARRVASRARSARCSARRRSRRSSSSRAAAARSACVSHGDYAARALARNLNCQPSRARHVTTPRRDGGCPRSVMSHAPRATDQALSGTETSRFSGAIRLRLAAPRTGPADADHLSAIGLRRRSGQIPANLRDRPRVFLLGNATDFSSAREPPLPCGSLLFRVGASSSAWEPPLPRGSLLIRG